MLNAIARYILGTSNDRLLKSLAAPVAAIGALEADLAGLSDESLRARTDEFRTRLAEGEGVEDLFVEAFATVREAARRMLGERPFDVQLMGGIVLHRGMIAEMKTGEGKTLVATMPVYLNALEGKGVHVVTVNDYLAQRDSEWMGRIYGFLGLSVGCIVHGVSDDERRQAYAADVTYGTNNEFGFDYLRDNHEIRPRGIGAAAVQLRHRRRGRQHPDRRGAHPADHLGTHRGQLGALRHPRQVHSQAHRRGLREGTRRRAR